MLSLVCAIHHSWRPTSSQCQLPMEDCVKKSKIDSVHWGNRIKAYHSLLHGHIYGVYCTPEMVHGLALHVRRQEHWQDHADVLNTVQCRHSAIVW